MIDPDLENLIRAEVSVVLTCSSQWKIPEGHEKTKLRELANAFREICEKAIV